jgi:hypothetical protein
MDQPQKKSGSKEVGKLKIDKTINTYSGNVKIKCWEK